MSDPRWSIVLRNPENILPQERAPRMRILETLYERHGDRLHGLLFGPTIALRRHPGRDGTDFALMVRADHTCTWVPVGLGPYSIPLLHAALDLLELRTELTAWAAELGSETQAAAAGEQ